VVAQLEIGRYIFVSHPCDVASDPGAQQPHLDPTLRRRHTPDAGASAGAPTDGGGCFFNVVFVFARAPPQQLAAPAAGTGARARTRNMVASPAAVAAPLGTVSAAPL